MSNTTREDVADYLKRVKRAMMQSKTDPRKFVLVMRDKNISTITRLGYTRDDVRDSILGLSVEDYCQGPEPDPDVKGDVWVFGKKTQGLEVYVKLKLSGGSRLEMTRLISFHLAESPLTYPFSPQCTETAPNLGP